MIVNIKNFRRQKQKLEIEPGTGKILPRKLNKQVLTASVYLPAHASELLKRYGEGTGGRYRAMFME